MHQPTVLLYGEDAGDAYYFWQWLDGPDREPHAFAVDRDPLSTALAKLERALPNGDDDETVVVVTERIRTGAFGNLESESELAHELGHLLIPDELARSLIAVSQHPVLLRVLPSPSCSRVPWELLAVRDNMRLLEIANVAIDPPVGLYGVREVPPSDWTEGPAAYIIDPFVTGIPPLLLPKQRKYVDKLIGRSEESDNHQRASFTRADLSRLLRANPRPSAFIYFGHVAEVRDAYQSSEPAQPAILLSDKLNVYGTAGILRKGTTALRPLSAMDLMQGTLHSAERERALRESDEFDPRFELKVTVDREQHGSVLWPMPPRVALIACDSGGDLSQIEPFGLVMACLNAGAQLVTATRWVLPTDAVFRRTDDLANTDPEPLVRLLAAVVSAHRLPDPVAALANWRRLRLHAWLGSDHPADSLDLNPASPVLWAAIATTVAPNKVPRPLTAEEKELLGEVD